MLIVKFQSILHGTGVALDLYTEYLKPNANIALLAVAKLIRSNEHKSNYHLHVLSLNSAIQRHSFA